MFKVERGDQISVWLETGGILFAIQIGAHSQACPGTGGPNEVEHGFIAGQWLGGPVLRDL